MISIETTTLRDSYINQVAENAGLKFCDAAINFIVWFLGMVGEASGEQISNAGSLAGIVACNGERAWGAPVRWLSLRGVIEKCDTCLRSKGHGTSGGVVWRLCK